MTNTYLERIEEAKRLYAELVAQPENEEIRAAFGTLFEAIWDYFIVLLRTNELTEEDRKKGFEWKHFADGLDFAIVDGAAYRPEGDWRPRKFGKVIHDESLIAKIDAQYQDERKRVLDG